MSTPGDGIRSQDNAALLEQGGADALRLLAHVSDDMLAIASMEDGRWKLVNPSMTRVLGWTAEEFLATSTADLLHPEDRGSAREATTALERDGRLVDFEIRLRRSDGEYRWISWNTVVRGPLMYCSGRDVTEQRQAREATSASERMLAAVIDNAPAFIYLVDRQGRYVVVNRAYEGLLSMPAGELQERTIFDVFPPETAETLLANNLQVLESGATVEFEEHATVGDGEEAVYSSIKAPMLDEHGYAWAVLGISTDITAIKRNEASLREAQRSAEEALRAREEFLSIASHELRNPVAAIRGSVQILERTLRSDSLTPERLSSYVGLLENSSRQLARLTNDLLDLSRLERGRFPLAPEEVDLGTLLREVAGGGASEADRVRLEVPDGPRTAVADPDRLTQIFENLLDNALKYSDADAPVLVRLMPEAEGFLVQVRDYGIGVPEQALEAIFDPFRRAENASAVQGLGIGLSISRRIAQAHGGRLWADSEGEGTGTTMNLWLPWVARDAGADGEAGDEAAEPATVTPSTPRS